jgi:D-glycero-D-manno-heptose 1,7-bisphosphate phosphatase
MSRRAVFLDRDGVLVQERGYLTRPSEMEVVAGAYEAVRALRRLGFEVIVVTNQSAVARGLLSVGELDVLHEELLERFAAADAPLDGVYACPHHPEGTVTALRRVCDCRKPAPGLVLRAARERRIALEGSWLVGDQWSDLECARAAGVAAVLVRTGKGGALEERVRRERPDVVVCDSIADLPGLVGRGLGASALEHS